MLSDGDTISTVGSIWGIIGLIVTGVFGLLIAWAKKAPPETKSTAAAANTGVAATDAILDWIEEHTILPMRQDLAKANERIDALQVALATLQRQYTEQSGRLAESESHNAILMAQLGRNAGGGND